MGHDTLIERAFDLARSGNVHSVSEITRQLTGEGFTQVANHLAAPTLRKQLRALILVGRTSG